MDILPTAGNLHQNVVDGDVNELHKEPNETHDSESHCCCQGDFLELCSDKTEILVIRAHPSQSHQLSPVWSETFDHWMWWGGGGGGGGGGETIFQNTCILVFPDHIFPWTVVLCGEILQ